MTDKSHSPSVISLDRSEQIKNIATQDGNSARLAEFSPNYPQAVNKAVQDKLEVEMLIAIALTAIFTLATLGVVSTLLDAVIRGANAYPRVKRAAQTGEHRKVRVRQFTTLEVGTLPVSRAARGPRPLLANRAARRGQRQPLSAAA